MKFFYLIRHGEAHSAEEDPARGLNEQGRSDIERIAHTLKAKEVKVDAIYHSHKLRAAQTAEIIAKKLEMTEKLKALPYLDPESNINQLSSFFESLEENAMLVGHMPNLDVLTGYLLSTRADEIDFAFSPGCVVCLKLTEEGYRLEWFISPSEGTTLI